MLTNKTAIPKPMPMLSTSNIRYKSTRQIKSAQSGIKFPSHAINPNKLKS